MTFYDLPPLIRALFLLAELIAFLFFIYKTAYLVRLKSGKKQAFASLVVVVCEYIFMQMLFAVHRGERTFPIPVIMAFIFVGGFVIYDFFMMFKILQKKRDTITPMSIKEAVDKLPTGLCFYYPSGLCKLVNDRMDDICRKLTGEPLRDGSSFWEILTLKSESDVYGADNEESAIITMESGNVISFKRNRLQFADGTMYELTASDITEEYRLGIELRDKQQKAKEVNQRLRALGDKITEVTREEEILNSKIRIHDEWGRVLLMIRKCVLNPSGEEKQETFRLFDKNIALLESENELFGSDYEQSRDDIIHSANALGISVNIMGELPTEPEYSAIVNHAITVCASNLAQHTDGHILSIAGKKEAAKYIIRLTNDGGISGETIREAGGLKNLRKRIENAGGRMTIDCSEGFRLVIELGDVSREEKDGI